MYVKAYNGLRTRAQNATLPVEYNQSLDRATGLMQKAMQLPLEGDADFSTIDFRLETATIVQDVAKLKARLAIYCSIRLTLGIRNC